MFGLRRSCIFDLVHIFVSECSVIRLVSFFFSKSKNFLIFFSLALESVEKKFGCNMRAKSASVLHPIHTGMRVCPLQGNTRRSVFLFFYFFFFLVKGNYTSRDYAAAHNGN